MFCNPFINPNRDMQLADISSQKPLKVKRSMKTGYFYLNNHLYNCEVPARSCEILKFGLLPKQNHPTAWESSVVSLKCFEGLLDFSQQHVTYDK